MINKENELKLLIAGCEILCGFSLQEIIDNELEGVQHITTTESDNLQQEVMNDNS